MKTLFTKKFLLIAALASIGTLHATVVPATTAHHTGKIHLDQIAFNATVSGDGFGMQYVPSLGIRFGKRVVVSGGPVFCAEDWKNTGYSAGLRYYVLDNEESFKGHMRLSVQGSFEQYKNQCLGNSTIRSEKYAARSLEPTAKANLESLRFSGWECSAGFAMSYQFGFGLFLRTEAGLAYYNSESNVDCMQMMRENHATCLKLGTAIGWKF
jgi:hypothetical protein